MFKRFVAATLSSIIALPALSVAPSAQQGPTCGQIASDFDQKTAAFKKDADQQNLAFVQKQFGGDPLRDPFESAKAQIEKVQKWAEDLNNVSLCLRSGSACNTTSLRERLGDEIKGWLDGHLGEGLAGARQRAEEASNLLNSYLTNVMKITTDTMTAMSQCSTAMKSQPRGADLNRVSPSPTTAGEMPVIAEPPSKPVDKPADSGGGGNGAIVWGLVGAAGLGYALYELMPSEEGGDSCPTSRPTSNTLTICSSQGGSSSACQNALSDWRTYCQSCGKTYSTSNGSCQ